jgi:putative acetyltransferase
MTPHLRLIHPSDNKPLGQVIRAAFIEHGAPAQGTVFSDPTTDDLYSYFRKEGSIFWVATDNDIILGGCSIYPTEGLPEGYAELVKFYLAPEGRGRGIGKLLFNKCEESAREMGYSQLYIESLPHFNAAVSMYTRYGFETLSRPLGNSGHTSCNIWMSKKL